MNGFACLISELGGGLPDLGWFLFVHHFKEESQARFLSYQAPVGGTGSPLNEPWFEEVMSKKTDFGQVHFACVTIELGGGLPDLGWNFCVHHFKEKSQARFLSYQTQVGGTDIPPFWFAIFPIFLVIFDDFWKKKNRKVKNN